MAAVSVLALVALAAGSPSTSTVAAAGSTTAGRSHSPATSNGFDWNG